MKAALILIFAFVLLEFDTCAQPFDGFVKFDGYNDALYIKASEVFPEESDYTIEFWFKNCNDTGYIQEAFMGNGQDLEVNFFSPIGDTTNIYQRCAEADNFTYDCSQDHQLPKDEEWHHLAVTFDYYQSEFEYYFDGIDGTSTEDFDYDPLFLDTFFIGRGNRQLWLWNHFDGYMDEVRFSNVMRYNGNFTPDTAAFNNDINTIALWHMNDSTDQDSVFDSSGNQHHLSVVHNPHILWPIDTLQRIETGGEYQGYAWSRSQPQSNCPVPTSGYNIYILGNEPEITDSTDTNLSAHDQLNHWNSYHEIKLYPNPCISQLNLSSSNLDLGRFYLFDVKGQLQLSGQFNNRTKTIYLADLPTGMYVLKLKWNNEVQHFKILKQ